MTLDKDAGSSPGYFHSPLLQSRSGLHSKCNVMRQAGGYDDDEVSNELSQRLASRGDGKRRHVPTSPAGSFATPSRKSSSTEHQGSPSLTYSVKSKFGTNFSEQLMLKRQGGSEQEHGGNLHVKDAGKRFTPTFGGARKFHAMKVQEQWKKSGSYSRSSVMPPSHSLSEVEQVTIQSKGKKEMSDQSGEGVEKEDGVESVGVAERAKSISDRASVVSGTSAVSFMGHSHSKPAWKPSQESKGIARVKGIGLLRGEEREKSDEGRIEIAPVVQEKHVTGTSSRTMEHILFQLPMSERQPIGEKEEALKSLVTAKELRKELKNIVSIPLSSHAAESVDEETEPLVMVNGTNKEEILAKLADLRSEALSRYKMVDETKRDDKPGNLDIPRGGSSQGGGLPSPEVVERLDRIKLLSENADKLWKQKSTSECK